MVALSGVILYWRGLWNLFDMWLGTDDLLGNVGSLVIGLSVILLFRIFKVGVRRGIGTTWGLAARRQAAIARAPC